MKKLVVVLLLVSLSRVAYAVPTGCFKSDYMVSCYYGYFYASDCDQYNMSSYNFGTYINSMCDYVNSVESTGAACINTLATVATQRDNATALATSTDQNRQEWIAYAGTRDKLIKKLYKACGSKCKRIK